MRLDSLTDLPEPPAGDAAVSPGLRNVRSSQGPLKRATGAIHSGLLSVLFSCLAALYPLAAPAAVVSFDGTNAYPVGSNPKSFTIGDCDGDGLPDLVAPGQNSNDLVVLRGAGDGRFAFARTDGVVTQPTGAACVDLDGDGLADYAAVSRNTGVVSFYRQQPSGALTPIGSRPAGVVPSSLASGDVNSDGRTDLVAVGSQSNDVTVLVNTGAGGIPPFATVRVPIVSPRAAAIADFNQDGFADIAVAGSGSPYVVVLYGDGVGFAARTDGVPSPFAQTRRPGNGVGIAAGELNQDGVPDLVFLSADGLLALYTGNGAGSFALLDTLGVPPGTESVGLADLNSDGLDDLVLANSEANSLQVVLAAAPGKFPLTGTAPAAQVYNLLGLAASRTVLLDQRDPTSTHTQVVAADRVTHNVVLMEQGESGRLSVSPVMPLSAEPQALLLADMNGDAIVDAVVAMRESRNSVALQILLGDATGVLEQPPSATGTCGDGVLEGAELCDDGNLKARDGCNKKCKPELSRSVTSLVAADMNGDAAVDLVAMDERGQLALLLGDGKGRFREVRLLGKGLRRTSAAVDDFTGDGTIDIAFIPKSTREGALVLYSNDGQAHMTPTAIPSGARFLGPLLAGDFDRNGFADLVLGSRGGWTVLYNDGAGLVREGVSRVVAKGLKAFAAADFDEDGWLDLLATFSSAKTAPLLFRGTSDGKFSGPLSLGVGGDLTVPFVVDVNEDEHQDIVDCSGGLAPACRVFYGTGTGAFAVQAETLTSSHFVGREVRGAEAADLDADTAVDLVGVSRLDGRVVVLFNNPGLEPIARVTLETGMRPESLALVDLNGDGLLDIVVANEGSRDLSVFMNQGARRFVAAAPVRLPRGVGGAVALAVGDLNNDGRQDLVVSQADSATVTPFLNLGGGLSAVGSLETGTTPRGLALGNLNGDGVLDIVTANRDANTFSVLLSTPAGTYTRADYNGGGLSPWDLTVVDLDGDGRDDVVVANGQIALDSQVGSLVSFLNNGSGSFGAPSSVHVRARETPRSICAGDFDADGLPDLAVASIASGDVMVLHGAGDGRWKSNELDFPLGQGPISVSCSELDGDGRSDIVFARKMAGDVGLVLTTK